MVKTDNDTMNTSEILGIYEYCCEFCCKRLLFWFQGKQAHQTKDAPQIGSPCISNTENVNVSPLKYGFHALATKLF